MTTSKNKTKLRLDDVVEKVTHPWQAWFHVTKQRKFYTNVVTKKSIWEHPEMLEKQPKPGKPGVKASRKRRENVEAAEEPMEVEQVESKRRVPETSEAEIEECVVRKRRKVKEEEMESIPMVNQPTTIRSTSPVIPTLLPDVSWSEKIRPYKLIPYRACAVFDTCSLISNCTVLDDAVEKQILSVIPYSVIGELDGLKNDPNLRPAAQRVSWKLKELCTEKNHYLHMETSAEQRIVVPEYVANASVKDDLILKCALRIKREVVSIAESLKLNEAAILFVTDDTNLGLKAEAHGMIVENVDDFLNVINDRPKAPPKKKSERRSEPKDCYPRKSCDKQTVRAETRREEVRQAVEKRRKHNEWISSMLTRRVVDERGETIQKLEGTKPRPSIPLADELSPIKETPKRLSSNHQNYTRFPRISHFESKSIKKPEPSKPRPQIPCCSSDEDDSMDCT